MVGSKPPPLQAAPWPPVPPNTKEDIRRILQDRSVRTIKITERG